MPVGRRLVSAPASLRLLCFSYVYSNSHVAHTLAASAVGTGGLLGELMGVSSGNNDVAKTLTELAGKLIAKLKDPATVSMICSTLKSANPTMIMALLAAVNVPDAERRSKCVI